MRQLGLPAASVPFEAVTAAYEDLTLEYLPTCSMGSRRRSSASPGAIGSA